MTEVALTSLHNLIEDALGVRKSVESGKKSTVFGQNVTENGAGTPLKLPHKS